MFTQTVYTAPPEPTVSTTQELAHAQYAVVKQGIYRHYKGNLYQVIDISCDANDLSVYVVYTCLYQNPVSQVWHRRIEDFCQVGVWIQGQAPCARFEFVRHASPD